MVGAEECGTAPEVSGPELGGIANAESGWGDLGRLSPHPGIADPIFDLR